MILSSKVVRVIGVGVALAFTSVSGASISFNSTDVDGRSATATFDVVGGDLVVTLTNDAAMDAMVPIHILTTVFFEYDGSPLTLTPVSAFLNAGSVVLFDSAPPAGNVGGEWGYVGNAVWPEGSGYGIGSAGLGIFSAANFNGPDLDPPTGVNGLNYGITSTGDNPATGNTPVTGSLPLIKDSVVFRLSGLPQNFTLSGLNNVWFQYGTDLSEPRNPTPGTLALLGIGGLVLGRRRR